MVQYKTNQNKLLLITIFKPFNFILLLKISKQIKDSKMKICAIICEYNPFHYGHLEHIKLSKEKSGADAILCIMAGNYSQRGEPTILNKYIRARMAIEAGADIVVQIPTAYATSSAEIFALAGVKIANSFENVTHLSFGCETTNYELLIKLAEFLSDEPQEYKEAFKNYMNKGESVAVARQKAIEDLMKDNVVNFSNSMEISNILQKPNNILAIEYLKCLYKTKSKIQPVFTQRENSDFHSADLNGRDTSATAIRMKLYKTNKARSVKKLVPKFSYRLIKKELKTFGLPSLELFSDLCLFSIKVKNLDEIRNTFDVTEGLENRLKQASNTTKDINELLFNVKSKRYTYTRIKRIILRLLLGIEKDTISKIYTTDKLPFIKVLAFKADRIELLNNISANTDLIIRNSNVVKNPDAYYKKLATIEDVANSTYNLLLKKSKVVPSFAPDLLTKSIKY